MVALKCAPPQSIIIQPLWSKFELEILLQKWSDPILAVKVGGVIVVHRQKVITLDVKKTWKTRDPFDDGLYVCHAMFELWFFLA